MARLATMLRLGQFAIWPFAEKQNDPNAHLQFINSARNAVVPNSPFFLQLLCYFLDRESFCTILLSPVKISIFLVGFLHAFVKWSASTARAQSLQKLQALFFRWASEKTMRLLCTLFFNLNGTTRKFNLQHFPPLLHQNVYQCFKGLSFKL